MAYQSVQPKLREAEGRAYSGPRIRLDGRPIGSFSPGEIRRLRRLSRDAVPDLTRPLYELAFYDEFSQTQIGHDLLTEEMSSLIEAMDREAVKEGLAVRVAKASRPKPEE